MNAKYYKIDTYEAGIGTTGSRSANYHCYCMIYNENMIEMRLHPLSDVFYGKWRRCSTVINKWRKLVEKAKLLPKP